MNYTELKQEVTDWIHRTDLESKMDRFCELSEAAINKELRTAEMETRLNINFTDPFTNLPTDYLETRALQVNDTARRPIKFYTPDQLDRLYSQVGGAARAAAIHGGQIEIRPGPSTESPAVCEWSYYKRVPTLVTNQSNDILTNYPLLYLSAMLFNANKYVQDDEQAGYWSNIFIEQIKTANMVTSRYHLPEMRAF